MANEKGANVTGILDWDVERYYKQRLLDCLVNSRWGRWPAIYKMSYYISRREIGHTILRSGLQLSITPEFQNGRLLDSFQRGGFVQNLIIHVEWILTGMAKRVRMNGQSDLDASEKNMGYQAFSEELGQLVEIYHFSCKIEYLYSLQIFRVVRFIYQIMEK